MGARPLIGSVVMGLSALPLEKANHFNFCSKGTFFLRPSL